MTTPGAAHTLPVMNPHPTSPPPAARAGTLSNAPNPYGAGAGADTSYTQIIDNYLTQWGLGSLIPIVTQLGQDPANNSDMIYLKLQQTDQWKQRFAGNEMRKAAGLSVLSPAEYLALESQYHNVMKSYGLPAGFYDSPSDYAKWIGGDVSPTEIAQRAQIAHDTFENAPPEMKNLWSQYFGTKGDAIAAILDPDTATSVIADRAQQVQIGGAAAAHGLAVSQGRAQQFQQAGVDLTKARQAYSQIAQSLGTDTQIASRFGQQFGQQQEEDSILLGDGKAQQQRQSLYDSEQGLFHSKSALDERALGVSQAL